MGLLQYTSNEMYSSTELIRKSKGIFDKLSKNEIEKAIILRDGKPSFMLLEFYKYENLINEYLSLKEENEKLKEKLKTKNKDNETLSTEPKNQIVQNEETIDIDEDEIDDDELEKALAKIEQMDIDLDTDMNENKPSNEEVEQNIKDFWD